MIRLNFLLLAVAIACALGTVAAQHQARKLFVALEKEQERSKQLENEFRQLQLEVSTWSMQARIERIAAAKLDMRALTPNRIQMLVPAEQQVAAR
jgi:cell division protein FtsL